MSPIYVIAGKDKFLLSRQYDRLIDRLLPEDQRSMALYQPEAEPIVLADVLDELRTLPFEADRRVVLIKDAGDFISENRQSLEKYFDAPADKGVLILVVGTWAKNTKLAKKLVKVGQLIDIGQMKPAQLPKFVSNYATNEHGKSLQQNAARLLVTSVGDDPGRLCSEVDKLAVYVGNEKSIKPDDVEKLVGHNRMFNAFSVIDAVLAGDRASAISRLRNMFSTDKSAEYTSVGAFAYHVRRMFRARAMMDNRINTRQIQTTLRIWGDSAGFFRQVSKLNLRQIAMMLAELARIDYSIKTGVTTASVAIECLVMRLSAI